MYTPVFSQAGRDRANRHLHALCSMVLGAEYSDPVLNHGPNPSADVPGRHEQPRRPAQQPPESSHRCTEIPREEPACKGARSGNGASLATTSSGHSGNAGKTAYSKVPRRRRPSAAKCTPTAICSLYHYQTQLRLCAGFVGSRYLYGDVAASS